MATSRSIRQTSIDSPRSVVFRRAYAQFPVCNPSRCSFLTGRRPDQTGVLDNRTLLRSRDPDVITLPQWFKQSGYYTASLGKIFHIRPIKDADVQQQWLDMPLSWNEAQAFGTTPAGNHLIAGRNLTGNSLRWCRWGSTAGSDDDQPDGQIAQAAVDQIDQQREPAWFVAVGFLKPHDPFNCAGQVL